MTSLTSAEPSAPPSQVDIACIVEGQGEELALPVLLRRIAAEIDLNVYLNTSRPIRVHRDDMVRHPDRIARYLSLAADRVASGHRGGILVLLDADDDCAAAASRALLEIARSERSDIATSVVFACREYESWFLAGARSLQGARALNSDLQPPSNFEAIRDAKGWLTDRMPAGVKYSPTIDQAGLSAAVSLSDVLAVSSSFCKLWREIFRLMNSPIPNITDTTPGSVA